MCSMPYKTSLMNPQEQRQEKYMFISAKDVELNRGPVNLGRFQLTTVSK